ncbi:MAG: D-glycero-alpha-D-manno-heptose-1,7-bisphosphate 7-phosphatase [Promethearchaeota archaeon]
MVKKKAIILDRDGTLIEDRDYAYKIEDFEILPGVIEGLNLLKERFLLFIVTNQSGIGKGYYSIENFHTFNNHLLNTLDKNRINIEKTYFCPHLTEDHCECKKPKPKFIQLIAKEYNINLKESWIIGDHPSDILFGLNGGCKTAYLRTGHGERHVEELEQQNIKPDIIIDNFLEACKLILNKN